MFMFFLSVDSATGANYDHNIVKSDPMTQQIYDSQQVTSDAPNAKPFKVPRDPGTSRFQATSQKTRPDYFHGINPADYQYHRDHYYGNSQEWDYPLLSEEDKLNIMYGDLDDSQLQSRQKRGRRKDNKKKDRFDTDMGDGSDVRSGKGFSSEYYIKRRILKGYDRTTRPVRNDSDPVTVTVGMSLYHILDTVSCTIVPGNWREGLM